MLVNSAKAATTVAGIYVGYCKESAEGITGTRWCDKHVCMLRDWLTDR